jgi:hypothetical protein
MSELPGRTEAEAGNAAQQLSGDSNVKSEQYEEEEKAQNANSNVKSEQREEEQKAQNANSNAKSTQHENAAPAQNSSSEKPTTPTSSNRVDSEKPKLRPRTKTQKLKAKLEKQKQKAFAKAPPPRGYVAPPRPPAAAGSTLRFTFVRAENLPVADLNTGSSDPFIVATLTSPGITPRHKQDPELRLRTRTIHRDTNPHWAQQWIVAGVPSAGFRLKCRIYDEDSSDSDDRLGNVTVAVAGIGVEWPGFKERSYPVEKRMGSWRAYFVQGVAAMCSSEAHFTARLVLSIEVLGRSDEPYGRMYTLGPGSWTKHYSPMMGLIAGTKAPHDDDCVSGSKSNVEKYE